jgi:hypothetical protein
MLRSRNIEPIGLRDAFTQTAGDHQHALGEHVLDDGQVHERLLLWLNAPLPTDARE